MLPPSVGGGLWRLPSLRTITPMARWCSARLIGFAKRSGSRFASLTLRRARSCPHVRDGGRRTGRPAVLSARHVSAVLGAVLFRQLVGRNAEAVHQVVEIHHHVAHLFHKMPAHLRLLQPLLSDDVSDLRRNFREALSKSPAFPQNPCRFPQSDFLICFVIAFFSLATLRYKKRKKPILIGFLPLSL